MARRVFLHIGTMKSGTTSLQDWCDRNQEVLAEAGVLWNHSEVNFAAVRDFFGSPMSRPRDAGAWPRLQRRIEQHPGDALISNEILSFRPRAKVGMIVRALAPAEVHVIITVRNLVATIPSQWQESTRNAHTLTLDEFVSELMDDGDGKSSEVAAWFWRRHDVARHIQRWRQFVPLDRITVVTVPPRRAAQGGDPLQSRIATVVGFDAALLEASTPRHASIGAYSAELMRRVNQRAGHLSWNDYRDGLQFALADAVLAARATAEPPIRLTMEQVAWATVRAEKLVEHVKRIHVPVVGDINELVPPPDDGLLQASSAAPNLAEITDVALDGLVGMGEVHAQLRHDHEALVSALAEYVGWNLEERPPRSSTEPVAWSTGEALLRQQGRYLAALLDSRRARESES